MAKKTDRSTMILADLLFDLAKRDNSFASSKNDLGTIKTTLDHNLRLKEFFRNAAIKHSAKEDVIDKLFKPVIGNTVLVYFKKVVELDGTSELSTIFQLYIDRVETDEKIAFASVTSSVELPESARNDLAGQLKRMTGKDIVIEVHVDPSIIGGVIIRVEGKVFDASLSKRFAELHNKLLVAV